MPMPPAREPVQRKGARSLSLKARALRLLAQREHSRRELQRKLAPHEQQPGQLEQVLDELQARGYLSEQRLAQSLVHRRAAQLGQLRLRQEMQEKGLARELIEQTLAGLQGSELQRAQALWRRRFGVTPSDMRERARQARFLQARGFSAEVVRRVLTDAGAPLTDEE
jgi:regulatory protein